MRTLLFLALAAAPLLTAQTVGTVGQTTPSVDSTQATKDPNAVAIMRRAAAVLGNSVSPLTDVVLQGRITQQRALDQEHGTFTYKVMGRNAQRLEIHAGSRNVEKVVSAGRGTNTENGNRTKVPLHALLNSNSEFFPLACYVVTSRDYKGARRKPITSPITSAKSGWDGTKSGS